MQLIDIKFANLENHQISNNKPKPNKIRSQSQIGQEQKTSKCAVILILDGIKIEISYL
jgi:hypothetical protein